MKKISNWYQRACFDVMMAKEASFVILPGETASMQAVKEAISKRDIIATLLALSTFLAIPYEYRKAKDFRDWIAGRGGSEQTAVQIAKAVGKTSPMDLTQDDVAKVSHMVRKTPAMPQDMPETPASAEVSRRSPLGSEDYWRGRDKSHAGELSQKVRQNAGILTERVNSLLEELGVEEAKVSSGWRPQSYNDELRRKGVPAARKSMHISGEAVDISDPGGAIAKAVMADPSILDRHGLWMESPSKTRGWVHFDLGSGRSTHLPGGGVRKNRVFNP